MVSPEAAEEESNDISEADFAVSSTEPSIENQIRRKKRGRAGGVLGKRVLVCQKQGLSVFDNTESSFDGMLR